MKAYAIGKGLENPDALLEALERSDMKAFASRPQDLGDLIAHWIQHGELGTRKDIIQTNIDKLTQSYPMSTVC